MAHKPRKQVKQTSPVQYRPGVELDRLVRGFATERGLLPNEAYKVLAALAVTGMDLRYYGLVRQLADAIGGVNAFVRACVEIKGYLGGAALVTGQPIHNEPERSRLIFKIVFDVLATQGKQIDSQGLWFLPEPSQSTAEQEKLERARTAPRRRHYTKIDEEDLPQYGREQESDTSTSQEQPPQQRVGQ